jgi:heat shock protein HslJ
MGTSPGLRIAVIGWLLVLGLAGCDAAGPSRGGASPAASPAFFVGPRWSALAIRGLDVPPGTPVTVRFTVDSVEGTGPCNTFGGSYRFDAGSGAIVFDQLASTPRGCVDENRTAIDTSFFQVLSRADRLFVDPDGRLHLTGPAGDVVLAKLVEG